MNTTRCILVSDSTGEVAARNVWCFLTERQWGRECFISDPVFMYAGLVPEYNSAVVGAIYIFITVGMTACSNIGIYLYF